MTSHSWVLLWLGTHPALWLGLGLAFGGLVGLVGLLNGIAAVLGSDDGRW